MHHCLHPVASRPPCRWQGCWAEHQGAPCLQAQSSASIRLPQSQGKTLPDLSGKLFVSYNTLQRYEGFQGVLTNVGQAEVQVASHGHAGAQRAQHIPACCWWCILLVLSGDHLQLVQRPDSRPALAQQGLGRKQGWGRMDAAVPLASAQSPITLTPISHSQQMHFLRGLPRWSFFIATSPREDNSQALG